MNKVLGLFALMVVFLLGCTPKVWEIDAKLGVRVDSESEFYAYYSPAPKVAPQEVRLYVASEDSIVQPKAIKGGGGAEIVPISVSTNNQVFLHPESLERILEVGETDFIEEGSWVEIGYFCKQLYFADSHGIIEPIFKNLVKIAPGGWAWGEPTEKLEKLVKENMVTCSSAAAKYGAESIVDIRVFFTTESDFIYGGPGAYLYGKAIVSVVE